MATLKEFMEEITFMNLPEGKIKEFYEEYRELTRKCEEQKSAINKLMVELEYLRAEIEGLTGRIRQ